VFAIRADIFDKVEARLRMAIHSSQTRSPAKTALEEALKTIAGLRDLDARSKIHNKRHALALQRLGVVDAVNAMVKQIIEEEAKGGSPPRP